MSKEKEEINNYNNLLKKLIYDDQCTYFVSKKSKTGYYFPMFLETKYSECDINDYLNFNDSVNKIIIKFEEKLKDNFPGDYLSNFNNNLKALGFYDDRLNFFKRITDLVKSGGAIAYYDMFNNDLHVFDNVCSDKDFEHILMHELFHIASTSNITNCGLNSIVMTSKNKIISFGDGLNEGYTEYLLSKYFDIPKNSVFYKEQVQMAKMIEKMVGKDLMEKSYFKSGLITIINKLSELSSCDLAIDTLLSIDKTTYRSSEYGNRRIFKDARNNISDIFISKLNKDLEDGIIDDDTYHTSKYINCDVYRFFNYSFTKGNTSLSFDCDDKVYILDDVGKSLTCSPTREYAKYVKNKKLTKYNY